MKIGFSTLWLSLSFSDHVRSRAMFGDSGDLNSRAAQNRRASTCHRERAAQPGVERSKSAKPTLQPSAYVPSASPPPPIDVLLKTKAKPQFDRAVDRAVEALFRVFSGLNRIVSVLPLLGQNIRLQILYVFAQNIQRIESNHSVITCECKANYFFSAPELRSPNQGSRIAPLLRASIRSAFFADGMDWQSGMATRVAFRALVAMRSAGGATQR